MLRHNDHEQPVYIPKYNLVYKLVDRDHYGGRSKPLKERHRPHEVVELSLFSRRNDNDLSRADGGF